MKTTTIATQDGPMPASVADPAGAPRGAILVLQEAFGLNSHIESVAARLADEGWLAVAPALFHRAGNPTFAYDDYQGLLPVLRQLTQETIADDLGAALRWIAAEGIPPERTGVVGFCMGGSLALHAAVTQPVGAAVTFYGGGVAEGRFGLDPLVTSAPRIQAPWLGLYGDLDTGIPSADVEDLRVAAQQASAPTEVVRYPEAEHGFNCDERASFHAESAADAWARMLAWFDRHLAPA